MSIHLDKQEKNYLSEEGQPALGGGQQALQVRQGQRPLVLPGGDDCARQAGQGPTEEEEAQYL